MKQRGSFSVIGLGRAFRIADDNNSGSLSFEEFSKAVRDFGVNLDPIDVQGLFKSMDLDGSGEIDFNEFLRVVVGDMNPFRKSLVERAFRTLDINQDNNVSLQELAVKYDASNHPDVRQGKKSEEQVLNEFAQTFEIHHALINDKKESNGIKRGDGFVSLEEFIEYYNNISCSIDNDSYFDLMISSAWKLDGSNDPASMPYAGSSKKVS